MSRAAVRPQNHAISIDRMASDPHEPGPMHTIAGWQGSVSGIPAPPTRGPVALQSASIADDRDGVDLDEIVGRSHLADLDHGGGGRGRPEIFPPHFMNLLEMLHVADIDVDAADVVHGAARLLDRGLQIFADLPGLRFDVADAGDRPIRATRGHAGNEHDAAARLDHGRVGKVAGWLADL